MDEGISSLPPSEGCVTVGEIGNLIAFEPRITFACGLHSEGAGAGDHSLLTDEEKSTACADMEAYLGMGEDERDLMNELDIWKVLSSPRELLYLSHAQANQAGEPLRAAPAIAAIRRIFPGLTVLGTVEGAQGALHPLAPNRRWMQSARVCAEGTCTANGCKPSVGYGSSLIIMARC